MKYAALILVLCAGCLSRQPKEGVLPLPYSAVHGAKRVPALAKFSPTRPTRVTVRWQCADTPYAKRYVTGIECSPDGQRDWQEVATLSYSVANSVTMTTDKPMQFYRVFTSIK